MYKKTIVYEDFNEIQRTQNFYFYLSKVKLTKLNASVEGGIQEKFEKIVNKFDVNGLIDVVDKLIRYSYGEKSDDGTRFIQSDELSEEFSQTNAYEVLFMELINDPDTLADFIKKVLPKDLQAKIDEEMAKGNIPSIVPAEEAKEAKALEIKKQ